MTRWGMVVDLQTCIGCNGCTEICQQVNQVPAGGSWRQVPIYRQVDTPLAPELALPFSCMQCSDAPCLDVCPTTATFRRADGIVDIEYDLCIGCGYCVVACPYMARHINKYDQSLHLPSITDMPSTFLNGSDRSGVCTKCNFCIPRVEAGIGRGYEPGIDPQATPTCVAYCTTNALHFGDLNDPESNVSQLIRENETALMQKDLNTGPAIYYLLGDAVKRLLPDKSDVPLVRRRKQTVWKWPAVVNFVFGGMAAGLYLVGLLMYVLGVWETAVFKWVAPMLTITGFLTLTLEAGRPLRSRYLLRHLRHSWMSRETLAAVIFVPLALFDWFMPHRALQVVAAIAAAGFMVSQGFIIYRSRGIVSWDVWPVPYLFVTSGLATGTGLALLLSSLQRITVPQFLATTALIVIIFNLAAWLAYLYIPRTKEFQTTTAPLRNRISMLVVAGGGHVLPTLLLIWLLTNQPMTASQPLYGLVGASIITGGVMQKAGMVLRAGYLRSITLQKNHTVENATIPISVLSR